VASLRASRPWAAGLICAETRKDRLPSRSTSRPGCARTEPDMPRPANGQPRPGARAYLDRATRRCDIATLVRQRRDRCRDGSPTAGRVSPAALRVLKPSPGRLRSRSSPAPRTRTWPSRSTRRLVPTGSPTSSRPQARLPADAIAGALRLGPHGGATTASWGFVRMAPSRRSPDNRGMLRGVPAVGPTRASSRDDVGSWTVRSTTEAPLLVEQSANRRAGARA
jgi:hypothetical protein